ncbi:hypothetical protein [Leptolyngbya sp. FACHB-261]|uniref:hypothetical protein n=1 Tax=Leptolyngbya sp. FACHB-261 TaxID=2692806 RepID=UPI00168A12AE|nr:hypothetical protein [Leptolyngbya sp. FACHB-261]MBD2100195.1 hypothetical protein [Leptolyngbya sp. FACHB-261]
MHPETGAPPSESVWPIWLMARRLLRLAKEVLNSSSSELHIQQQLNQFQQTYWSVSDPATGFQGSSGSEAEIVAWIEKRYTHSSRSPLSKPSLTSSLHKLVITSGLLRSV